jgi:hypothetical protein
VRTPAVFLLLFASLALSTIAGAKEPLKIYILAGQSNMQGHARVETFDYIGDDPATAPLLKQMRGADGKPRVCESAWISYLTGSRDIQGEGVGRLTAGYGARQEPTKDGGKIGPEFTFGLTMEKASDGPILIIKTAWGGKSLHTDFRSPSAGSYEFAEAQFEKFTKQGKDIETVKADKVKATGHYYRLMTDHVKKVLADIKRVYPDYDPRQGYELAGFVWFQGFNDMVDRGTYPNRDKPGGYAKYSEWMAHFIRDVRKDLDAPKMHFVIGVMGVGGVKEEPDYFRQAMAAPATMLEFKGNVATVETAPYWNKPLADIERIFGKPKKIAYYLRKGGVPGRVVADNYPIAYAMRNEFWDTPAEDRKMTKGEQQAYVKEYRAKVITAEEETMWQRGASNAGYHYLGCAKTMALIGRTFAETMLEMERK